MRASVDVERCAGHGACVITCPDVFDLTDDGYAEVLVEQVPAGSVTSARQAARQCPELAITLTEA